ncbi:MAG: transposase, partial [Coprothermobacterota bacterium]|nr:transposase [Coprothermobacterota bacterium]
DSTEHQAEVITCSCGCVNHAAFPPEVSAPVQYGPRLKSLVVYLRDYHLLPCERLSEIMRDLFGCGSFSEGTLTNFDADCSRRLEPVDASIRDLAAAAKVAGFDETGVRAIGSLHWLHTVSTPRLTWYFAHKRRGREAMDVASILPTFRGRAVHDFWKSYLKYDCKHAFCNAHLLRELIFLDEEQKQRWASPMIDHLLMIKDAVDAARDVDLAALPVEDLDRFMKDYRRIVEEGYAENPVTDWSAGPKRRGLPPCWTSVVSAAISPRPGRTASTLLTLCVGSFWETPSSPLSTPLSRSCSPAGASTEDEAFYPDNLPLARFLFTL